MPIEQPNNAPDPPEPRDEASPGVILSDDAAGPGGGGLMGADGVTPPRAAGGPSPNLPSDVPVPGVADGGAIEHEAAVRAVDEDEADRRSR